MAADILSLSTPWSQRLTNSDVLVVEDDRLAQRFTVDALTQAGLSARVAQSLETARQQMREQLPALLLIDGVLPDGSGMELIHELRQAGVKIPIIFLSAFYRDQESFVALRCDLGVACILHKPVTPEHVAFRVKWALGNEAHQFPATIAPAIAG
jgi:DNA-binding response OmpR family regulator